MKSCSGYWAQDIYSVNSNFGTEDDLIALSAALHSRGMYLMVDIVTNHMGYLGCGDCVDYSVFNPFNTVRSFRSVSLLQLTRPSNLITTPFASLTIQIPLVLKCVGKATI